MLCAYIDDRKFEARNPDVNMEVEIAAVYYGMSVDRSHKILRHVRIVAVRSQYRSIASSDIALTSGL